MTLQELKTAIENNTLDDRSIIFKYSDNLFIAEQYVKAISINKSLEIQQVDSVNNIYKTTNIFGIPKKELLVYRADEVSNLNTSTVKDNVYIFCKKATNCDLEVITLPKLDDWQLNDYAYTVASGVDKGKLDRLVNICNKNIYRLDSELQKLAIFNEQERNVLFDELQTDGAFTDLSDHTIFDFSDAIIKRDYKKLCSLYQEINQIDCEPLGLVTILWKQFRRVILVQLQAAPTEQNTGIPSKQIWAIKKYNCGYYTKEQLYKAFDLLTDIDRRIKCGEMPMDNRGATFLRDYIVTQILIG